MARVEIDARGILAYRVSVLRAHVGAGVLAPRREHRQPQVVVVVVVEAVLVANWIRHVLRDQIHLYLLRFDLVYDDVVGGVELLVDFREVVDYVLDGVVFAPIEELEVDRVRLGVGSDVGY